MFKHSYSCVLSSILMELFQRGRVLDYINSVAYKFVH
jgi:hypothetical protein